MAPGFRGAFEIFYFVFFLWILVFFCLYSLDLGILVLCLPYCIPSVAPCIPPSPFKFLRLKSDISILPKR